MQKLVLISGVVAAAVMVVPGAYAQEQINPEAAASEEAAPGVQERSEREISMTEVPVPAMAAAKDALEAEPKKAYVVTLISGEEVYEIEADSPSGGESAVYVTATGEVVEKEGTGQNSKQ